MTDLYVPTQARAFNLYGYQPFDLRIYRLADDKLQLIDGGKWAILLAVIDDTLRSCSADMEILAHFVSACSINIDELTSGS
jgi:hypothetical protein